MTPLRIILLLLAPALLAACEQKQPYRPPVPQTDKDKAQSRLFEPERQALDKAKGVEGTVEQGAEARKREIDKQTD